MVTSTLSSLGAVSEKGFCILWISLGGVSEKGFGILLDNARKRDVLQIVVTFFST